MADISPYQIDIPEEQIVDLKQRLALAKFPRDELDGSGWDYGSPLSDVKRLTAYWRDRFDWREVETRLNQLPHFTTSIQCDGFESLKIHFLHQKSEVEAAIPLLFVHGWPGSFLEVTKIIEELPRGSGRQPSFHVVALSLPNYGFSQGSKKKGFAIEQYAETCHKLMLRLGYNEYVTQGGDWGMYITRALSLMYPSSCLATHLNMDNGGPPSWTTHPLLALRHALTPYTARDRAGLARTAWFLAEGTGYRAQQSTKPQTLGYALADSPVALLAWIYEKLHDWTDSYNWTDAEVCTWVSVYWFSTAGPAANVRIYYEAVHHYHNNNDSTGAAAEEEKKKKKKNKITRERVAQYIPRVKVGLSHFPAELRVYPATWTRTQGDVVFQRTHDRGGHFAAWERPDAIVQDLRDMFARDGGGAYGVVRGRDGYGHDRYMAGASKL